jgi:hypothetical protein
MSLSIYEGNIFLMDIRYVDHDPLSRLQPIDNTSYATEAERIDKKKRTPDIERFDPAPPPPRPVKCPDDLTSITL